MTMKPKAKRFRIRRSIQADSPAVKNTGGEEYLKAAGAEQERRTTTQPSTNDQQPLQGTEQALEEIRRQGLTSRQLRMARRIAQKHGLNPASDFDAVRLLQANGIDPFQRGNMLELVVPNSTTNTSMAGDAKLPQNTTEGQGIQLPAAGLSPSERRQIEIAQIQRGITRRRRRKMGLLLTRLAFFVFLPTLVAGYYFYKVATPMYATKSEFLLLSNDGGGGRGGLGGLLPAQFSSSQDSIAVQAFLQSKDAMLRLDRDTGFRAQFLDPSLDVIQRLPKDANNEETYKVYRKRVKIGYDPTEGVIRMEVVAPSASVSENFSRELLRYAEERVNALSLKKRKGAMRDAEQAMQSALQKRRDTQESLIKLQVKHGIDPQAEIGALRSQITNYETILIEKELELAALLDNTRPNRAKVEGVQADIRRITAQVDKLNDKLNTATEGSNSLAQRAVEIQMAQADLAAADANMQAAQMQMEQARTEAGKQVRYLTVAVQPIAPQEATYPRKFENTILAFVIFAGIYLMLSLTASILREQITS